MSDTHYLPVGLSGRCTGECLVSDTHYLPVGLVSDECLTPITYQLPDEGRVPGADAQRLSRIVRTSWR